MDGKRGEAGEKEKGSWTYGLFEGKFGEGNAMFDSSTVGFSIGFRFALPKTCSDVTYGCVLHSLGM